MRSVGGWRQFEAGRLSPVRELRALERLPHSEHTVDEAAADSMEARERPTVGTGLQERGLALDGREETALQDGNRSRGCFGGRRWVATRAFGGGRARLCFGSVAS